LIHFYKRYIYNIDYNTAVYLQNTQTPTKGQISHTISRQQPNEIEVEDELLEDEDTRPRHLELDSSQILRRSR
jgi:hypothetical protein